MIMLVIIMIIMVCHDCGDDVLSKHSDKNKRENHMLLAGYDVLTTTPQNQPRWQRSRKIIKHSDGLTFSCVYFLD